LRARRAPRRRAGRRDTGARAICTASRWRPRAARACHGAQGYAGRCRCPRLAGGRRFPALGAGTVKPPLTFPRSWARALLPPRLVLITRCAWHRGYHGHPALIGVTDWKGLRLGFRDGICSRCAAQLRADLPDSPPARVGTRMDVAGLAPGAGLVAVAVMAIVLLAARPVHEPGEPPRMALAERSGSGPAANEPSASPAGPGAGFVGTRSGPSRNAGPVRLRAPARKIPSRGDLSQAP